MEEIVEDLLIRIDWQHPCLLFLKYCKLASLIEDNEINISHLLTTDGKLRIYKTCIRPVLTYAAETRRDNAKTTAMINTAEMRVLRIIKGISLRDRLRSSQIRAECEITSIGTFVRTRRKMWYKHVDRLPDDRSEKIVVQQALVGVEDREEDHLEVGESSGHRAAHRKPTRNKPQGLNKS